MLADIPTKNPAKLKEWLEALPAAEKGRAFERTLAELYRGNGWLVSIQGQRGDEGADILLYHPKTPQSVSLIIQAKNHAKPLTLDQTRIELIKFEQQAAPRYKCQQFRLVAVNGFVEAASKLRQFNLLLDPWDHVAQLLKSYDPKKHTEPNIELFAHNRTAYERVQELWKENNQVAVVQATGTGKSFVIAKVLADFHARQKIVLAPSHYILDQQKSKVPWLNDRTTYWTYAGLMRKSPEQIKALKYSLIVLDEYHRCGADEWGKGVQRLLDSHPKAKILGTSATPIRYLDESRDMSEELFDGVVAVDLSLAEAIVKRILPAPIYISALYTLDEEIKAVQEEIDGSKRTAEEKAQFMQETEELKVNWEKTLGVPEILQKYLPKDINKLIVFCRDQEHLDQMESEVEKWFQKAGTHRWREKYRVLAEFPDSKKHLEKFKAAKAKDTVHLLFAIDMLNEGLHIQEVGAVILLRPTESHNIFYQQIGRCIEVGASHTPVIFDLVNNLQSIRASDFAFDIQDATAEENRIRKELGLDSYAPVVKIEDLSRGIEDVLSSIREKLNYWEVQFEALCAYREQYGHCIVPIKYSENRKLGRWVHTQRILNKEGRLSVDRFRRLDDKSFVWDANDAAWEEMFAALCKFKDKCGHCNVPQQYPEDPHLATWVVTSRRLKRNRRMSPERILRLDEKGFVWEPNDAIWEEMFAALCKFKDKYGHCNVPQRYPENLRIGTWVLTQRQFRKEGTLSKDRLQRLDEKGFNWDANDAAWEKGFAALCAFQNKYGHCNVPRKYPENQQLASWVGNQRSFRGRGKLSEDRIRRLEEKNFAWNARDTAWQEMFAALCLFKDKFGHCNVPQRYLKNPRLASWVVTSRRMKRLGTLSADRTRLLEEKGFVWEPHDAIWEEMFKALSEYREKRGDCDVPNDYPENPSLGVWVITQRQYKKKGRLSADHIRRLEDIGFTWSKR